MHKKKTTRKERKKQRELQALILNKPLHKQPTPIQVDWAYPKQETLNNQYLDRSGSLKKGGRIKYEDTRKLR